MRFNGQISLYSMVSIIICTYNRKEYLPKCLLHLKEQNCKASEFEIVIINNNSTDDTDQICKEFYDSNPNLNITYAIEENPGLSHARNRGITEAKGELFCFIDDDGYAIPEYVSIISDFGMNPEYNEYMAFGGKVIPCYNPGKNPQWISPYISGLVSEVNLGDKVKPFTKKYPAGCNMIFRKSFFERHGGFNTDLHTRGDDKYIFYKLKEEGYKILYIPQLEVQHFIDDYRLEKSFIIRLSKVIGQSERIRLENFSWTSKILKQLEYLIKLDLSIALCILFFCKGQFSKASYIVRVRWYVLVGYYLKEKL